MIPLSPSDRERRSMRLLFIIVAACCVSAASQTTSKPHIQRVASGGAHQLKATPKTIVWGYYAASMQPVLRIKSGDAVDVETLITNSPQRLEQAGVRPADVQQNLRDIYEQVTDKGPGGHILTGPIFVEGAEPGDVLEVRIEKIDLAIPYAYNGFGPNRGFLPEDFNYSKIKVIPLDSRRMTAEFAPEIRI